MSTQTAPRYDTGPVRRRHGWPRGSWRPDRTSVVPRATMAAAWGAGAVAAVTLQVSVANVAYLLTGLAVAATAYATMPPRPAPLQVLGVAGALALLAVPAIRGAGWLAALCVAASAVVGAVVLVGPRTWTGIAAASVAPWCTPLRVLGWVRRGRRRGRTEREVKPVRVLVVAAISGCLALVFGALFASADPEFARLFGAMIPEVQVSNPVGRLLLGGVVAGVALGVAYLRRRPPAVDLLALRPSRPVARWEWAVPVAVLTALFAGFVAVQVRTLFGGAGHVRDTAELTYADYARQGFWQLTAVTVLTLAVIAVAARRADRRTIRDRLLVRALLGALCVLTLVVVASALHRMTLYENEFGYTRLRLAVRATELWLGVVFALVLAAGVRLSGRWLPRAVLASAALGLLGFAALNPDGHIAEQNVQRYADTGRIDVDYLRTLSVDAVPALDRLPEPERSCTLSRIAVREGLAGRAGDPVRAGATWYEFNFARTRAAQILADRPVGTCAAPAVSR